MMDRKQEIIKATWNPQFVLEEVPASAGDLTLYTATYGVGVPGTPNEVIVGPIAATITEGDEDGQYVITASVPAASQVDADGEYPDPGLYVQEFKLVDGTGAIVFKAQSELELVDGYL